MSQITKVFDGTSKPDLETLTGNSGGAVGADGAFNINVLGSNGITTVGNPGANTITIQGLGSFNEQQIIYVGKHGNDANSGLNIDVAKLTFGAAITAAAAIAPAVVVCLDKGIYVENITGVTNVDIYAPNATLNGNSVMGAGNTWYFNRMFANAGTVVTVNTLNGEQRLIVEWFTADNNANGFDVSNGSYLDAHVRVIAFVNGNCINSTTGGNVLFNFQRCSGDGTGSFVSTSTTCMINVTGEYYTDGAHSSTLVSCANVASTIVNMIIDEINVTNLSNIGVQPDVRIISAYLHGTLLEIGAGTVNSICGATKIENVPIGASKATTGRFTTLSATLTSHGILMGNGTSAAIQSTAEPANGQILIGKTGDFPQLAGLTPGPGISVSSGAGSITVSAIGGGLSWSTKGASGALVNNNAYVCTSGAALSFSLPAAASVGDVVAITLDGSTSWTITQGGGQQIRMANSQTTLGAGGSLASTAQGDTVTMVCSVANTRWNVISSMGNITVV